MVTRIHIYDLDGVLVDTSHRYRNLPCGKIDLAYWLENHTAENMANDKLLPLVRQYRADVANPHIYVIICTARQYSETDVAFIRDKLGMPNKLIMRPVGNNTADAILKRRQLVPLFNLRQFRNAVRRFWDDNILNLDALRAYGVECFHVKSEQGHR